MSDSCFKMFWALEAGSVVSYNAENVLLEVGKCCGDTFFQFVLKSAQKTYSVRLDNTQMVWFDTKLLFKTVKPMEWTVQFSNDVTYSQFKLAVKAGLGLVDVTDIDVSHRICIDDDDDSIEVVSFYEAQHVSSHRHENEDSDDEFVMV